MKRSMIFCLLTALCASASAQVPAYFNYQAIAKGSTGTVLANQAISLRLSIIDSTATTSAAVFVETQNVTTSADGLFNVEVGRVNQTLGNLNWGSGMKFFVLEMDVTGGTSFVFVGRTQLISVPFAMVAHKLAAPADPRDVPCFPGGRYDSIVSIFLNKGSVSYTVPSGYILYYTSNFYKSYAGGVPSDGFPPGLVPAGATIYAPDSGYRTAFLLKDRGYQVVQVSIGTSYTVPAGKDLMMFPSGAARLASGFTITPSFYGHPMALPSGTQIVQTPPGCTGTCPGGFSGYLINK